MKKVAISGMVTMALTFAGSVSAAPFWDDFSTDTSDDYTHEDTHGSGGSFEIDTSEQVLSVIGGAEGSNTSTVTHNTARLETGEYVAVDIVESNIRENVGLSISTGGGNPNASDDDSGVRFFWSEGDWEARIVQGGDSTNLLGSDVPDAGQGEEPWTQYIFRDSDTQFRFGVDLHDGAGLQTLSFSGAETISIPEADGVEGMAVGMEIWTNLYGEDPATFDNLRIVPEPGSLALLGAASGMLLVRRRRC